MASQQQQPEVEEAAEIIASFTSYYVGNYCGFATIALFVYDSVITVDKEVGLFWRRKLTGASLLFFLNRYIFLAGSLLELGGLSPMSAATCSRYILAAKAIEFAQYLPWAAFSALRVFALSCATRTVLVNRLRWPLAILVLLLSLVPLGINYYSYTLASGINDPVFGCSGTMDIPAAMSTKVVIASRSCLIAADLLVLIVTWNTTYRASRMHRAAQLGNASMSSTLLRDGTVYFL
ncbi:hypothetical protein BV20DRAFT_973561 [Pilatotrama ljubarskyi]|nr:hypothetical protein BV20DRAFT_973561 [Pilatotrama ljubarskyi]